MNAATHALLRSPPDVSRWAAKWNRLRTDGARIAVVAIQRPSGHVNHHMRLYTRDAKQFSLSLGATDAATLDAGAAALVALAQRPQRG